MKQIILTGATCFLALTVLPVKLSAQPAKKDFVFNSVPASQYYASPADKEYFAETYRSDIHIKAVRNFGKSFKTVKNEKWHRITDGFLATFSENGIKTDVYYNKKGYWLYNFLTYDEDQLTASIRDSVKNKYKDCNILKAHEYQFYDGPVYVVKMKDANIYRMVMITDNKMKIIEEYQQQ